MTPPDSGEFEVFLRELIGELGTVADSLYEILSRAETTPRHELTDVLWRIEALKRFYDFALAERRNLVPTTSAGLAVAHAAQARQEVDFMGAELERGREAAAASRRDFVTGDDAAGRQNFARAVTACSEAGRRLEYAASKGWDTGTLPRELTELATEIEDAHRPSPGNATILP
jgi:hypothetical protein